jgi:hypothetical protein
MKKIIWFICLIGLVGLTINQNVFGYEPNYLPGGKNYISKDNYIYTSADSGLNPLDPFVVKPETTYTLSFPELLFSQAFEVEILMYHNDVQTATLYFMDIDFDTDDIGVETAYTSFDTPVDVNYMEIYLYGVNMEDENIIPNIQLEEGDQATVYEAYIEGTMIDTTSPYFQSSGTIISYVDQPITVTEIQNSLSAYDKVDGDVSTSIALVNDGYTDYMDTLGIYDLSFSVSDLSGNTSEIIIHVEVVDVLAPVFSDVTEITAIYPNTLTTAEIIAMLSASDNYDGDISSQITLSNDNYSENASIIGSYPMQFSVSDSSGNTTDHDVLIHVVDQEAPMILGDESLVIGYNNYYSEATMLSSLSVSDNYDQNVEIIITSNNYKNNAETIGEYTVVFSATDSSGNQTEKTLTVFVVDEIGPMIYLDLSVIQVYSDTVMTLPDFAQLLTKTHELDPEEDYLITVKYDSYTSHAEIEGTYHLQLQFEDVNGDIFDKDLQINVIDKGSDAIIFGYVEEDMNFVEIYQEEIIYSGAALLFVLSNLSWFIVWRKKN